MRKELELYDHFIIVGAVSAARQAVMDYPITRKDIRNIERCSYHRRGCI